MEIASPAIAIAIAIAIVNVFFGLDPKYFTIVDSVWFVLSGFYGIKYPTTVFAAIGIGPRQIGQALQEGRGSHSRDQNEFHLVLVSNLIHQRQGLCRDHAR